MAQEKTLWLGSRKCDFCGFEIHHELYDGATVQGPWATMCKPCFCTYGKGISYGSGQRYIENEEGEFECVEGLPTKDSFEYKALKSAFGDVDLINEVMGDIL